VKIIKPQHAIGATLRSVTGVGNPQWMFLDVFEDGPAARAGVPGQLSISVNGTSTIPPAFPPFRFGQEHQVTTSLLNQAESRNIVITVPQRKVHKGRPPLIEPKSVSHRMLTQRVGLLRVPFFAGLFGLSFSMLLRTAVALKIQGCDRLIVDLRECLG
jgi:C-terminal processing protease CtpA/Prc